MRNNGTSYREKGRAVFLAVIMVLSVVAMSAAFAGSATADDDDLTETFDELGDGDYWAGQTLTITDLDDAAPGGEADAVYLVEGTPGNPGEVVETFRGADTITLDSDLTSDLDGPYHIEVEGDGDSEKSSALWWETQEVDFEFDPAAVTAGEDAESTLTFAEDNRGDDVTLNISSDDVDAEEMEDIFGDYPVDEDGVVTIEDASQGDDFAATLSDLDVGEYEFTIDVTDTTAYDTATVEVTEPVDGEISLVDDAEQNVGDVLSADFALENASEIDEVYVTIESDYTAEVAINVEDVDEDQDVTLFWNTYAAGADEDAFWAEAEDEDVSVSINDAEDTDLGDNVLPTDIYTVNVYDGDDRDNRVDIGSFTVTDRDLGDIGSSIAPVDDSSMLTEGNVVAKGDYLFMEVEVSGVYGQAYDGDGNFDETNFDHINVTVESQFDPTFDDPDRDASELGDIHGLEVDEENNTVSIPINTEYDDWENPETADYPFDFEVLVSEEYALADEDETSETTFEIVDGVAELDPFVEEPYQVTPDDEAVIEGTTTYAPGTEIELEITKSGVFSDVETVEVVEEDGEFVWQHQADYSDRTAGEEFEIQSDEFESDAHGDTVAAVFDEVPERDTATDADAYEAILDELVDMFDDVDEYDEIVDGVSDKIEALETERDALKGDLEDANATIADLEDEIAGLEGDLADADSEIGQLESDLQNANTEIDELEDEIADLEDELESNGDDNGDDDDDDGQPGFGVAVALVALIGAAMLATRRRS